MTVFADTKSITKSRLHCSTKQLLKFADLESTVQSRFSDNNSSHILRFIGYFVKDNLLKSVHFLNTVQPWILSSFKIVIIFNNTSAKIKTKSTDVSLKMITILKELRIAQLCFKNERTLAPLTI